MTRITKRVCTCVGCGAHPGSCPNIVDSGRCPRCRREAAQRRGTTTQQGLGWEHQQNRDRLITAAIGTVCPDCGDMMSDPRQMVADHSTPRSTGQRTHADRVHCRRCSDRQGGQLAPRPGG